MSETTTSRAWEGPEALDRCTRRNVVRGGGGLQLRRGEMAADEAARCNNRDLERIAGGRWIRKRLVLGPVSAPGAKLIGYLSCDRAGGELEALVNGHTTRFVWQEKREYWVDRWHAVEIDPAWLREGENEIVLRAVGDAEWTVLVEESVQPDRSEVSDDGGRTWRSDELGVNDRVDGEYVVRLWLDQHMTAGEVCSEAVDLLGAEEGAIAAAGAALGVRVELQGQEPEGTGRRLEWRAGPTPAYEPEGWSAWAPLEGEAAVPEGARFFQWRALLSTRDPAATPTLTGARLSARVQPGAEAAARVVEADNRPLAYSSHRFSYMSTDEPRAKVLRERWKLDQVVGPAKTEFEAFTRLRQWVREQWEDGWNMGGLDYCPPWDALVILELAGQQLALGMCTHYASVFTQCCAALGFTARTQIMRSHCITEVWSNDYGKWVTMDPGGDSNDDTKFTYHFERHGVPLTALEAHTAWVNDDLDDIRVSPPPPEATGERFKVESRIHLWTRFMINRRNDEPATLGPGEPEHGAGSYHYDGYLFWEDDKTPALPWFSRHTDREADLYWDVDRTRIHLQAGGGDDLRVDLEAVCPNFERFEVRVDGGGWESRPAAFAWPLHAGENRLEARAVNAMGRAGAVSSVTTVSL